MVYTIGGVQYTRRKKIPVTGAGSGAQTNFQIKLAATWAAAMQADFDDVRFTKADMQTLIDAWLESKVDSTSADIWAEFPTTPADGVVKYEAYMYFGNGSVSNYWDIGATFIFGDDLESGNLNAWSGATSAYGAVGGAAYKGSYGCDRTQADGSWQFLTGSGDIQNGVWEAWVKQGVSSGYPHFTVRYLDGSNHVVFQMQASTNQIFIKDVGGTGNHAAALTHSTGTWYFMRATLNGTAAKLQVYNTSMGLLQTVNATVADRTDAFGFDCYRDAQFDEYKVRKYAANPPTAAFGTEEHQRRTPMMM